MGAANNRIRGSNEYVKDPYQIREKCNSKFSNNTESIIPVVNKMSVVIHDLF